MNRSRFLKRIIQIASPLFILLSFSTFSFAGCTGTPKTCANLVTEGCASCGCSYTAGYCSNNGACNSNTTSATCSSCSCAGCTWSGTSCPWVGSWDGNEWVLEHEAFPFAAFEGVSTTTYDSLPKLKCIDGSIKVKIFEGLPEKSHIKDFKLYKTEKVNGLVKPDLNGVPRVINEKRTPDGCNSSSEQECLTLISEYDEKFWEPKFDESKTEDWLEVEFKDVQSELSKLYIVARKQTLLTTYYEYMAHMMGEKQFGLFSKISTLGIFNKKVEQWWDENLKMKVELWDGQNWVSQGLISAGYHMPGSGADDFLVSLNKLEPNSNNIKVRFKFLTGGFGIDYLSLDTTQDPEIKISQINPIRSTLNDAPITNIFPLSMSLEDSLVMTYECDVNDSFYFSIDGYYLPDNYQKEREKSPICAWNELIDFFLSGKENVVENASKKGLYKHAQCMSSFTEEEIAEQQRECPSYYLLWVIFALILLIILFLLSKKLKKQYFISILIITLSSLGLSLGVISSYASQSCNGTLNCRNCTETSCKGCSRCIWTAPVCNGTPSNCSTFTNQSACSVCGCTWQSTGLLVDIVNASNVSVPAPSFSMVNKQLSFFPEISTGTLGTSAQKIFIQSDGTTRWQVSIAATNGPTALWQNAGNNKFYDFNDATSSAGDGGDSDTYGGQLSISPSGSTLTAGSGCTTTGLTRGSDSAFVEGSVNSILLLSATSQLNGCNWSLTNIGMSQIIPNEQAIDTYGLSLTFTIVAI